MATLRDSLSYVPNELKFGTSGLRALVTDMTDLECYINALGFIRFLQDRDRLRAGETIYLGGDLRDSTPRITRAVFQAVLDSRLSQAVNCGLVPTSALAYYALERNSPCIMVTGSHIPADRNGIKFYKRTGEILKPDEQLIKDAVAQARADLYTQEADESLFDHDGALKNPPELPAVTAEAAQTYVSRYETVFGADALQGMEIVFYQHSAVGRDLLVELLEKLGAKLIPEGRSEVFIPIDSENVTAENRRYFGELASAHPGAFAIVSTDGDSDRPFVIDETGVFHRGDVLGAVTASWLQADTAAYPVSSSNAVDTYLDQNSVPYMHTKIGSPYVITAMQGAKGSRPVGWEVNGGFMIGRDMFVSGKKLKALPTRDAILPIIVALVAARDETSSVSELFAKLPARYTQAGLIDEFPTEVSARMIARYAQDTPENRTELERYFGTKEGFGEITDINTLDGIRITFSNGDIAHMRPSGNAPQLRMYSVANTQERADEIVALALAEGGIFRTLEAGLS
jgi:phosphomannomutase